MDYGRLCRIKTLVEGEDAGAKRIMDGGDNYDGADGARTVIMLCKLARELIAEIETPKAAATTPIATFDQAIRQIAGEVASLCVRKQADYGPGNILEFGEFGVLVRLNDKVARLKNLQGKEAKNEAIDDTWMDVVGYGLIALMLRRGTFTLPLKATR